MKENASRKKKAKTTEQFPWLPYEEWVKVRFTSFFLGSNEKEKAKKWRNRKIKIKSMK